MRVLHLVHQYPPHSIGGTELYTQSLTGALTAQGHQITVCYRASTEGAGFQSRTDAGVRVVEMRAGRLTPVRRFLAGFGDGATRRAFAQLLDEVRPELVHIQHLMGLPLSMVRCVQERGIPFLITFHDYWWVCANAQLITNYSGEPCEGPRAFLNCARCALARAGQSAAAPLPLDRLWPAVPAVALLMAWRRRQLRSVLGQAQRLIAPSQFVWDWYASHGVPVDRLHLLPHGLAWPLNLVRKRERATALRLAYIGGLSWQKGVHVLLDALDGVPHETRQPLPDGTTDFERILPGPDRMYPDTDSAPIPVPAPVTSATFPSSLIPGLLLLSKRAPNAEC